MDIGICYVKEDELKMMRAVALGVRNPPNQIPGMWDNSRYWRWCYKCEILTRGKTKSLIGLGLGLSTHCFDCVLPLRKPFLADLWIGNHSNSILCLLSSAPTTSPPPQSPASSLPQEVFAFLLYPCHPWLPSAFAFEVIGA